MNVVIKNNGKNLHRLYVDGAEISSDYYQFIDFDLYITNPPNSYKFVYIKIPINKNTNYKLEGYMQGSLYIYANKIWGYQLAFATKTNYEYFNITFNNPLFNYIIVGFYISLTTPPIERYSLNTFKLTNLDTAETINIFHNNINSISFSL